MSHDTFNIPPPSPTPGCPAPRPDQIGCEAAGTQQTSEALSADEFLNPDNAWRGKPFWSWNGKLEKDELIRQIHVLQEMGMGGYFMHSRTGLATEYLGEEWFSLINACAEEGQRLGLESWLYDEDRWPSGTAGGMITADPAYRAKFIHMEIRDGNNFDPVTWMGEQGRPLGIWSCRLENEIDIFDVTPISVDTPHAELKGRTVLGFSIISMKEDSFYNGNTYVDTMNHAATDEFIRVTHEAYKEHCGEHFGSSIKGIFTDEPHRGPFMTGFGCNSGGNVHGTHLVPWTDVIFETFEKLHCERIEDHLPELFLRLEGNQVSHWKANYAETMLSLFLENFARPYYDWCTENDLLVTGHVLHENSLSCQVSTNGSVQRYYPLMHVPGIDYLGEHGRDYWVAKQVDSTARQFDQPWILSELYGCTGWQMNFESHKAVGAWQALFGVNLRCHHLSWYTMAGEAKRDYPASILHQSPWYSEYNTVETWFARLGYFRSQGTPCCDLLVLNPVESVWGRMYPGAIVGMGATDAGIQDLERKYSELFHILSGNHIDFDYGDEALLAEHGSVVVEEGTPRLVLGSMSYTTVLVSGMDTVRQSTLELLQQFIENGGRVIFAGDVPAYVDSIPSDAVSMTSADAVTCALDAAGIVSVLDGHTTQRVEIRRVDTSETATDVFCQLRSGDEECFLSVLNMDRNEPISVQISVSGVHGTCIEEWDLETGQPGLIESLRNEKLSFTTELHSSQARCFRICERSTASPGPAEAEDNFTTDGMALDGETAYELSDPNICVLDLASWSFDGGEEHPVNEILQIDRELRKQLDLPLRGGSMIQPWFRGKEESPVLGKLTLTYSLRIADNVIGELKELQLIIETPGEFSVTINGKPVGTNTDAGWWADIALRRIDLSVDLFQAGENEITITCDFREDINLEAMFLLGDFAVTMDGAVPCLSRLPDKLEPSSVVEQGLPYYSGSITYHYDVPEDLVGKGALVRVPSYEGAYAKVSSGDQSKIIPWRPNEATLTLGKTVDVEISITRKNTFGPLHLTNPRPSHTGPGHFVAGGERFSLEPVLIASGLLAPVTLHPPVSAD